MKLLVPIDFTPVTENALKYAIDFSDRQSVSEIILFHVVGTAKEIPAATGKLNLLAEQYREQSNIMLECHVEPGNIFDRIGSTARTLKATLIIMGTHGIKGLQHITGSKAMKVITQSETPYIVVQNKPFQQINKILIPVDYTREVKQLLPLVQSLNDKFKATLLLIKQSTKDEFISNKINMNLFYFKSYLKEHDIPFEEAGHFALSSKYKDVIKTAEVSSADLIVTPIDPETTIADYIMGVEEQKIVANELQLPVLCINIKHFMNINGGVFD